MNGLVRLTILACCLTVMSAGQLAGAQSAQAAYWFSNGAWCHTHHAGNWGMPYVDFVDGNAALRTATEVALSEWSNDTVLNMFPTGDFWGSRLRAFDDNYAWNFSGLAHAYCGGEHTVGWIELNNRYLNHANQQWKQAIACQEWGHTIGLDHAPNGGCMAAGYWSPWSQWHTAQDAAEVNVAYTGWPH